MKDAESLYAAQVITAFTSTSFIAICIALVHTMFTIIDKETFYTIDHLTARICRTLFSPKRLSDNTRLRCIGILEKVLLNLSDQQLLLGLAILISGLIRVCSISVYHFTIVGDLAWLASNVHIITLNALQAYFRENHTMRDWRAVLMVPMFVFQFAYIIMQSHWAWSDSYSSHAKCVFDDLPGNISGPSAYWMGFYLFLLITTYPQYVLWLYDDTREGYERWLYHKPRDFMTTRIKQLKALRSQKSGHQYAVIVIMLRFIRSAEMASWYILRIIHRVLVIYDDSLTVTWLVNLLWVAVGLYWIVNDRSVDPKYIKGDENEMGFGQLVPIFLLVSTVFVFQEALNGESLLLS